MKFTCNKSALSEAINSVSRAVSQRSTIAALEGIKVTVSDGQVQLTGYNLEIGIVSVLAAETEGEGSFVVSTRMFGEFTRHMSGENVTFDVNSELVINLSSGAAECSFSALSAADYPDLPQVDGGGTFTLKQQLLRSMVNQTSFAASTNETKPILTGELFDIEGGQFSLVAIDGFRLAIRTEPTDIQEKYSFVVPKKALQEVSSLVRDDTDKDIEISSNNRHIVFKLGNISVIARLLEGAFHQYRRSIPDGYKTEVIISKRELADSLNRISLIIDDKNKAPVRCEIGDGKLRISCKTGLGRINDTIPADISGESLTIGFNNRLLYEGLRVAEGDKVRLLFGGSMKVIEMLPLKGENYIFLVMPIQLKG